MLLNYKNFSAFMNFSVFTTVSLSVLSIASSSALASPESVTAAIARALKPQTTTPATAESPPRSGPAAHHVLNGARIGSSWGDSSGEHSVEALASASSRDLEQPQEADESWKQNPGEDILEFFNDAVAISRRVKSMSFNNPETKSRQIKIGKNNVDATDFNNNVMKDLHPDGFEPKIQNVEKWIGSTENMTKLTGTRKGLAVLDLNGSFSILPGRDAQVTVRALIVMLDSRIHALNKSKMTGLIETMREQIQCQASLGEVPHVTPEFIGARTQICEILSGGLNRTLLQEYTAKAPIAQVNRLAKSIYYYPLGSSPYSSSDSLNSDSGR